MKRIIFLLFISALLNVKVSAQDVKTINFSLIEERTTKSPDTIYIINFWATWCAPCVKELPYFEQLAEKYKNEPLKIILLSLDFKSRKEKDLIPFLEKYKLKSEVLLNENNDEEFINAVDKNWSGAIPAMLILNQKKGIRNFYEKEFTFEELENTYLKSK